MTSPHWNEAVSLPILHVLLEGDARSGWLVRSPAVGIWSGIPEPGTTLDAGQAGELTQAGRRYVLLFPEAAGGTVSAVDTGNRREIDVEWGQELFRIAPLDQGRNVEVTPDLPTNSPQMLVNVLVAPTDGVFYARPSPDAAAFVKPGDTVELGQAIGLIEVMKTFNHVLFAGEGLPASAVVEELLVSDGEEVRAGDPIVRYAPEG